MIFPEVRRVFYKNNPLVEVVARARFPTVLRISTEKPVQVQEFLRADFQDYERKVDSQFVEDSESGNPPEVMLDVEHEFTSEDGRWKLSFDENEVRLTCHDYDNWTEYREKLSGAMEAVAKAYQLSHFTSIALQYVDVISRSDLGFDKHEPWTELIQPYILGELSSEELAKVEVVSSMKHFMIKLPEGEGYLGVRHGLAEAEDKSETGYLIDFTFIRKRKVNHGEAIQNFDRFNRSARSFFHWCITERLHTAMGPKEA